MTVPTTLSPWLSVADDGAAIEFYERAFGAVELYRVPGGGVAQLAIDGQPFWLSNAEGTHDRATPSQLDVHTHWILLVVDDPDAAWKQAVAAGARPVTEIGDDHGWRSGRVADPDGHEWEIGRPLGAWPPPA